MKYKRKPSNIDKIEAFMWLVGPDHPEHPEWIEEALRTGKAEVVQHENGGLYMTSHNPNSKFEMWAEPGDYVCMTTKGELFSWHKEGFENEFEEDEEE